MMNFSIKSHITENFFTNHASRKKKLVCYQFFLLYHNNVSSKIRTLAIQPQKSIGKYSKHFTPKMPIIGQNRRRTSRHAGRFGLHPVDSLIIRLPTSMNYEKKRRVKRVWQVEFLPFQTSLGWLCSHVVSFKYNTIRYELRRHLLHLCYSLGYRHL